MADADSRAGIHFYGDAKILAYLERVHIKANTGLQQAFTSPQRHGLPPIMVGKSEGKLLALLLQLVDAKKVVEIGTLAGYSAIAMSDGLREDGHIHTIEFEPKHAMIARENIAAAKLTQYITVHQGGARDVLPKLTQEGPFDVVFLDADKGSYDHYGRWAAKNLRRGGLLLGDNAFLFGRLLEASEEGIAMRKFHEEAAKHFDTVCIPTPDGLLLGIKK